MCVCVCAFVRVCGCMYVLVLFPLISVLVCLRREVDIVLPGIDTWKVMIMVVVGIVIF